MHLAVNDTQFIVCDRSFLPLKTFPLNQIMKWGFSSENFIIIVENKEGETNGGNDLKLNFKTKMASEIVHVLNTILNIKQGKQPSANTLIVNENVTREIYENNFFKKSNLFPKQKAHPDGIPQKEKKLVEED